MASRMDRRINNFYAYYGEQMAALIEDGFSAGNRLKMLDLHKELMEQRKTVIREFFDK